MASTVPKRITVDLLRHASRRPTASGLRRSCPGPQLRCLHQTARRTAPNRTTSNAKQEGSNKSIRYARAAPVSILVGGGLLASIYAITQHEDSFEDIKGVERPHSDGRDPSLPRFRVADVRKHGSSSAHPWVIFEDKVYDITEWVAAHPGGDVILRAAGGNIEPYWNIFSIHKSAHVREILDQYLIGFIDTADLVDGRPAAEAIEDPFKDDPVRDPRLVTHTDKPRNAEPPNDEVVQAFKTPNELFYVRNHMWVPMIEKEKEGEYALEIELPDGGTRKYTLAELKARFPTHKVTAVLQCSGNRRNDMTRHVGKTNGLQWGVGAISNAEWEGVRLADVLTDAGLKTANPVSATQASGADSDAHDPRSLHVQFTGLEAYGSSIPLPKAVDPAGDVLLAFGMNGQPLPRDHGYPLRAVVPGTVAARSVKWLSKIVVSDEESPSQWQRRDYKMFGPNEGANPNWDRPPAMQEMPVTSAITGVWVGDCVRKGRVPGMGMGRNKEMGDVIDMGAVEKKVGFTPKDRLGGDKPTGVSTTAEPVAVQGYAYSGGGRGIARVDVSLDGGKTWDQAELIDDCSKPGACLGNKNWTWRRWRYLGRLPNMPVADATSNGKDSNPCTTLVVKATDDAYNSQPETHAGIYNVRGNLATAWHRVRICPKCTDNGDGKGVVWSTGETYGCGFKKEDDQVQEGKSDRK